jgi:hypothetical protein
VSIPDIEKDMTAAAVYPTSITIVFPSEGLIILLGGGVSYEWVRRTQLNLGDNL